MNIPQLPHASAFLPKGFKTSFFFFFWVQLSLSGRCDTEVAPRALYIEFREALSFLAIWKKVLGLVWDSITFSKELNFKTISCLSMSIHAFMRILMMPHWTTPWTEDLVVSSKGPGCLLQGPSPSFLGVPWPVPRIWLCQAHGRSIQRLLIPINNKLTFMELPGEWAEGWLDKFHKEICFSSSLSFCLFLPMYSNLEYGKKGYFQYFLSWQKRHLDGSMCVWEREGADSLSQLNPKHFLISHANSHYSWSYSRFIFCLQIPRMTNLVRTSSVVKPRPKNGQVR